MLIIIIYVFYSIHNTAGFIYGILFINAKRSGYCIMKNILCYGDSNTWGYIPGGRGRYAHDVRWTGVAAAMLGDDYRIIEEGLNGRTTVFDVPFDPVLNGKKHFMCSLMSHAPLDLVIIMLGTNDLMYGHTAWEASRGCVSLIKTALNSALQFAAAKPEVLLLAPILIGKNIADIDQSPLALSGRAESKKFAALYEAAALRFGAGFLDAAKYAEPSCIDCEHMEADGHRRLGEAVAIKIREMLG